jgi:hypothetical protein
MPATMTKCNVSTCKNQRVKNDVLCAKCVALRDAWSEAQRELAKKHPGV